MKPLDEEQLAAVEAAIENAFDLESAISLNKADQIKKAIWSKLRPKPKFAEGQALASTEFSRTYIRCNDGVDDLHNYRPLNLTELGPDVKALRDAARKSFDGSLLPALRAFDAKHGGEL